MGSRKRSFHGREREMRSRRHTVMRSLPMSILEMYTLPVSFDSFAARVRSRTGA